MSYCKNNHFQECLHDCPECIRYKECCSICSSNSTLYYYKNKILCEECILNLVRDDYIDDFIREYSSEFLEFLKKCCEDYRLPCDF